MGEAEIVARRRKWTPAEKAELLAEVEAEGGRVSVVARRHGVSDSLLYNWRSAWKAAASMRTEETVEFMRIGMIGAPSEQRPPLIAAPDKVPPMSGRQEGGAGTIEIILPAGARVRMDEAVSEKALSRVLRALKGSM
jgi:transposase